MTDGPTPRARSIQRKKNAYRATFCGDGAGPHPMGKIVLADLAQLCRMNKQRSGLVVSPVSRTVDPYATVYATALRDVYLRITGFLELTDHTFEDHDHERPTDGQSAEQ